MNRAIIFDVPPTRSLPLSFVRFALRNLLFEVPRNLSADPFSHWNRHAIPDHSVSIIVASSESECVSREVGYFGCTVLMRMTMLVVMADCA
jgi:hypothetical protein